MRTLRIFGLTASLALALSAGSATALNLEVGFFLTSSVFANPVTVNSLGSLSGQPVDIDVVLTPGDRIVLEVWVENDDEEDLSAIFASLVTDFTQVRFQSGGYSEILQESGAPMSPSLAPGPPAPFDKPNNPTSLLTGLENWVQAVAHTNAAGTTGRGPDIAAFLIYNYVGMGSEVVDLTIALTAGDALATVGGLPLAGAIDFQSAVIHVPEPGTMLLVGLGLLGLGALRQRRRQYGGGDRFGSQ